MSAAERSTSDFQHDRRRYRGSRRHHEENRAGMPGTRVSTDQVRRGVESSDSVDLHERNPDQGQHGADRPGPEENEVGWRPPSLWVRAAPAITKTRPETMNP